MIRPNAARHAALTVIVICIIYWVLKATRPDSLAPSIDADGSLDFMYPELTSQVDVNLEKHELNTPKPEFGFPATFPKIIWQTSTLSDKLKWENMTATWIEQNPGWQYNHLNDEETTDFVENNFAHLPAIVQFWTHLDDKILRADLFRYLALLASGGVYSDIDTSNLLPVDQWIPEHLYASVNAVIGIEYDDKPLSWAVRNVSFCQWTMMAKPGHQIFERVVRRVMGNLEFLARIQRVELSQVKLEFNEVLAATGPGLITDVVMEVLRDQLGTKLNFADFHDQHEPTIFGDVLILPVNAFAGNQKHSHSGDPDHGKMYVRHHFGRSWYQKQQDGQKTRPDLEKAMDVIDSLKVKKA